MRNKTRIPWNDYFLDIARIVSKRATCLRASVGAILVKDHRIIATGYNGSLPGAPHCLDEGCIIVKTNGTDHCVRTVHAEVNAVTQAARHGIATEGATLYEWDSGGRERACDDCDKAIQSAGIIATVVGGPNGTRHST
ncbi:hypothetical protein LCGC14_2656750 [marine sediment metagenome]|uniref:CMP/dCMP-type deaminase domain-containing protein n=1 Tax=marine sediment metagenome TaxID=412755 RepID=A0A0F9C3I9_9ZZZZ